MNAKILSVSMLDRKYGDRIAVDGVSWGTIRTGIAYPPARKKAQGQCFGKKGCGQGGPVTLTTRLILDF